MDSLQLVPFQPSAHAHLIEPLTDILHKAYAPLAAKGLKYLATHQPATKTLQRLQEGEAYLSFVDDTLVGTVTLYSEDPNSSCEYYRKPGVYCFGQFAVCPSQQSKGIGAKTMTFIEERARELGAKELALDTSEHAEHLIAMYEKRGYKIVAHTKWQVTNYRSVVMSKFL
jgi:GNAT superfamily N-acetyltransferase